MRQPLEPPARSSRAGEQPWWKGIASIKVEAGTGLEEGKDTNCYLYDRRCGRGRGRGRGVDVVYQP